MSICFINGKFSPAGQCCIPVTDLVIQRGVGVFDSIRLYGGKAFALTAHMKRLEKSARLARIDLGDGSIIEKMTGVVREGAMRPDCPDGGNCIAKAYITGGDVNEGGRFTMPRHFVIFESGGALSPGDYKEGVALQPTNEGRHYPLTKSINYLVGLIEGAGHNDIYECLYCPDGKITETLRSSFFICREGKIITAPVGAVLDGITRGIVIELARENGFNVEERCPEVSELAKADEAFITSSWKEVFPVVRVGDTVIGNGKPGPVVARLRQLFKANLDKWLDK
ncbi:MAG: aminotransferase class IV [Synergistaceae bacterium]|jgi:branched-chain amino acid aminotransferase|nr:aminotransferase class IV [Synergistaceae bacterium]